MMGVYDPTTGLNGFIDATDPAFAMYQVNMPHQFDLGISSPIATLGGQGANARIKPLNLAVLHRLLIMVW
jgi:hypothetical protein